MPYLDGIWQYTEADVFASESEKLNELGDSVRDELAPLKAPQPVNPIGFNTGWGSYGRGFQTAGWSQDLNGQVSLEGMPTRTGATISATSSPQAIGVLPVGARPSETVLFMTKGYYGTGYLDARIDVGTDGVITWRWIGAAATYVQDSAWVSLCGITFRAAS